MDLISIRSSVNLLLAPLRSLSILSSKLSMDNKCYVWLWELNLFQYYLEWGTLGWGFAIFKQKTFYIFNICLDLNSENLPSPAVTESKCAFIWKNCFRNRLRHELEPVCNAGDQSSGPPHPFSGHYTIPSPTRLDTSFCGLPYPCLYGDKSFIIEGLKVFWSSLDKFLLAVSLVLLSFQNYWPW